MNLIESQASAQSAPNGAIWPNVSNKNKNKIMLNYPKTDYAQDDIIDETMAFVLSGTLGQRATSSRGRVAIVSLFVKNDFINMTTGPDLIDAPLVALTNAKLITFKTDTFADELGKHADLARIVNESIFQQYSRLQDHMAVLALRSPLERIATFLLRILCNSGRKNGNLSLPLRHYDIARYLNMEPETLSRNFKKLTSLGIVKVIRPDCLCINNCVDLERIAKGYVP